MKKIYLVLLVWLSFGNCKNSNSDLDSTKIVDADTFIKAFPVSTLPVTIPDTALKNLGDTLIISKEVFTQFIADSSLELFTGSQNDYSIHPAGLLHKNERDFLLVKFSSSKQIKLGVFVMNDKHKFLAALPLLNTGEKDGYRHSVAITEEPTFIIKKEKIVNNTSLYSRNGFAYSASLNNFAKVLSDSNEDTVKNNEIINPIDTFPATNKYSGDYMSDARNFISIRDGKNALTYSFFIHFQKNSGECTGELKGMMSLTGEKTAIYSESGDPCTIDFKFTSTAISIKEQNNCGNHRGITCPFNFTFKKKKPEKKKAK